jgi:hypothetical protein
LYDYHIKCLILAVVDVRLFEMLQQTAIATLVGRNLIVAPESVLFKDDSSSTDLP